MVTIILHKAELKLKVWLDFRKLFVNRKTIGKAVYIICRNSLRRHIALQVLI